jgi:hypothetical protein
MKKAFHVVAKESGWKIEGTAAKGTVFKSQMSAVLEATKIAVEEKVPVVVHSRDGRVVSVTNHSPKVSGRKVFSANVKRTLNSKNVRNTIAEVIYSNKK